MDLRRIKQTDFLSITEIQKCLGCNFYKARDIFEKCQEMTTNAGYCKDYRRIHNSVLLQYLGLHEEVKR